MTTKFMNDPIRFVWEKGESFEFVDSYQNIRILVKRDELTLEGIKQFFVAVEKVCLPLQSLPFSCFSLHSFSFNIL